MRFALIEIKLLLARILTKYKFAKCSETPVCLFKRNFLLVHALILFLFNLKIPLVLKPLIPLPVKPIIVKIEKRF